MSKIKECLRVSHEEIRKVRYSYGKAEDDIREDVQLLLAWLNKQPHLPKPHDEDRLERFLVRNKFRIEQTKTKLDNYYTFKLLYPVFSMRTDLESVAMRNLRKAVAVAPLPKLTPALDRIFLCQFVENEAENYDFYLYIEHVIMIWELQLTYDYNVADIFVIDCTHMTLNHVLKADLTSLYNAFIVCQQAFSGRIAQVHYVNLPSVAETIINMLRSLLSAKLASKIMVHRGIESLVDVIPKNCLPADLGGTLETCQEIASKWYEELVVQKKFLKINGDRVANEALRVEKMPYSDQFGVDGTFKRINLD